MADNGPVHVDRPLTPLARGCLWLAGLLAVLMIAVVVNYVAHGGTEGLNPVAEAAERTAKMPGARLAVETKYWIPGGSPPVTGTGDGVFDGRTGRTDFNLSLPRPGGTPLFFEAISTPRKVFVRSSVLDDELPPGKLWLEIEPLLGGSEKTAFASNDSAKGMLESLQTVGGDVDREDQQIVRGDLTTRYTAEIDPAKVAKVLQEKGEPELAQAYELIAEEAPQPVKFEVWIDGKGLIRQTSTVQQLPVGDQGEMSIETKMLFYDFGPRRKVVPPKGKDVFDYTPVLRAELGLIDGTGLGPLTPPPGSPPLSVSAFRHRVIGMCNSTLVEAKKMLHEAPPFARELKAVGSQGIASGAARPILLRLGRWFEDPLYRLSVRVTKELAAVTPPVRYEDTFHRYLAEAPESAEWILAKGRAYQLGLLRVPGTKAHEADEKRREDELERLAASMGIQTCERDAPSHPSGQPA